MKKPSEEQLREQMRQRIIGLGEKSLKKSYYPELQKRIQELERTNKALEQEIAEREKAETQRAKLETQLRHSQKMDAIGTLAGGVAHDFNNILSAIIGYAELAGIHSHVCSQKPCPIEKDLEGILRGAERAKRLVQQILSFSSRQTHDQVLVLLHDVLKEPLQMLRAFIPTNISIEYECKVPDALVRVDPTQLHQVIMNLGTNAYHAIGERGGVLRVQVFEQTVRKDEVLFSRCKLPPGHYVALQVSDDGCGMEKRVMEKIFDPYFTTKTGSGGTGLGLSVVHGIITQHGGDISVYSEKAQGTVFTLYLPKIDEGKEEDAIPQDSASFLEGGTERLLVVDDEKELVEIMQRYLENLGYSVTTSGSPGEVLDLFWERPGDFDLLITDMNMPEMSGVQLISHIRQICPDLPVILCTGFSEHMNAERLSMQGKALYVMKPVTQRQLNNAIRELLDGKCGNGVS